MKGLLNKAISVICLCLIGLTAEAHTLTAAIATPDCDSQTIKLTFQGKNLDPGAFRVSYSILFAPLDGGGGITDVTGDFNGDVDGTGTFDVMTTVSVPALAGRRVAISGTATLYQAIEYNTVNLTDGVGNTVFEVNCISNTASLGDRVWEDLDADGIQDCSDTGGDGIIGNDGDTGPECSTGVSGVGVRLHTPGPDNLCYTGDGTFLALTNTDEDGFYLFDDLAPGDYCLRWKKPEGFVSCTLVGEGESDAIDSDGIDVGDACQLQDLPPINLEAGEDDRTWDLGLVRLPPPVASLGDRVWEDLDGDGVQDCSDDNNNNIIGDVGDGGAECGTGVENVTVNLGVPVGDDCSLTGPTTKTDANGFYGFTDLAVGDYCVQFDLSTVDPLFCETDGFDLGAPLFTTEGNGDDATGSDADESTGATGSVTLAEGDNNLTLDAGVICPAKIGDYVWLDTDGQGDQNEVGTGIPGVTVELFSCGPDGVKGGGDDFSTGETRVTDITGMYMFGAEPNYDLEPGCYYVTFTDPEGRDVTIPDAAGVDDANDSDCFVGDNMVMTGGIDVGSRQVDLSNDCGFVVPPPSCDLLLDKTCRVEAPPPQDFDKCDGKLTQFSVTWTGGPITISGLPNDAPNGAVATDQEVTFFGPFDSNDVFVDISGSSNGQSKFHMSCSDDDFNDPSDCGKAAGNGKDDNGGFLNLWTLEGFIDNEGRVLDCDGGSDGEFAQSCSFEKPVLPTCENGEKPDTLTWRYDGGTGGDGDCADSTFFTIVNEDGKQHEDFECSGNVNTSNQVTAVDDGGNSYIVNPGETFTTRRDDIDEITLTDGSGGLQTLVFHSSCSQPLEAQATAGALTLVGLDGRTGSRDVTYQYTVTNLGDPLSNLLVVDSELGTVGALSTFGSGATRSFEAMTALFDTTTNRADARGTLSDGSVCNALSDSVTVNVTEPTCQVSIELYKIEDDKAKWKLSNSSRIDATIEDVMLSWPGGTLLKKIKFDGNDILKDVALPSPVNISTWLKEVKDRTLVAGDSDKKIEFEFTDKFPLKDDQPASDFDLDVTFEEGCSVTF